MKGFSEKRRSEYIAQSRAVLEACRGASPALEERFAEALAGLSE
jgi:hypothetical protein